MEKRLEESLKFQSRQASESMSLTVSEVVCVPLVGETPKGGWTTEIKPDDSVHGIVAVHTQEGVSGYGSTYTNGFLAREGLKLLEPFLVGKNALEVGHLTETMHQNTFWMGRGGTLTHIISGINIALWDILGRFTGLPISTLLGGRCVERVKPYVSLLMDEPSRLREELAHYREMGYRAFKIGWGPFGRRDSFRSDEGIITAAREVLSDGEALMVDAGASDAFWPNGLKWAMRTADMLAEHDVAWFEEAIRPDDLDEFVLLRKHSRVPIAGGEVLTRRQSFAPFITAGAFDIVQPDVTKVGGITEQRRIVEMAEAFNIEYVGHGWNTALGLAADLQMASAFPNTRYVEYIGGSQYVDGIVKSAFQLDNDGSLCVPDTPGLGVDLDCDKLRRFVPDPAPLRL